MAATDCSGGNGNGNGEVGVSGGAGAIAVVYNSGLNNGGGGIYNNSNSFQSVTANNCSGGNELNFGNGNGYAGGGSGGIAVVYNSNSRSSRGGISNNSNSFHSVTANNCSGGNGNGNGLFGGGSGGIAVVYNSNSYSSGSGSIYNNINHFQSVAANNCSGGNENGNSGDDFGGGGAGVIAVVYNSDSGSIYNNINRFKSVTANNCSGGNENGNSGGGVYGGNGGNGGGAGAIAVVYNNGHGSSSINNNSNSFKSVTANSCSGGNGNGADSDKAGGGAGAIAVVYNGHGSSRISNNINGFKSVIANNCSGGNANGDADNNGAGGIAVVYNGVSSISNNSNSFQSVTTTNCSGGNGNGNMLVGKTGGIAVVYNSNNYNSNMGSSSISNNSNSFHSVNATNCSGGNGNGNGEVGVGAIAVFYNSGSSGSSSISNNSNSFQSVTATNCSGNGFYGGGAGGIAVVYASYGNSARSSISNNSNSFQRVTATNCSGGNGNGNEHGNNGVGGGGAGVIAVVYNSYSSGSSGSGSGSIYNNINRFQSVAANNCSGGNGGGGHYGGAGVIAVVYNSYIGGSSSISNNSNSFQSVTANNCVGGNAESDPAWTVGTGGIALIYGSHGSDNSATFLGTRISHCVGGDSGQGAGGLLVTSTGMQQRYFILVQDSAIESNTGGAVSSRNGIGVAGGARIYLSSNLSLLLIKDTSISRNRLICSSPTCIAGGLAVSGVNTSIISSNFDDNKSPSQAGALESTSHVSLDNTSFANNTALVFGTARLDLVRATNSTAFQFPDLELALQASFEGGSQYAIRCPAGTMVQRMGDIKWRCVSCPEGTYNLIEGTWVDGEQIVSCKRCPSQDTTEVICSGGTSVTSQPGFFLHMQPRTGTTIQVSRCPNPAACLGGGSHRTYHSALKGTQARSVPSVMLVGAPLKWSRSFASPAQTLAWLSLWHCCSQLVYTYPWRTHLQLPVVRRLHQPNNYLRCSRCSSCTLQCWKLLKTRRGHGRAQCSMQCTSQQLPQDQRVISIFGARLAGTLSKNSSFSSLHLQLGHCWFQAAATWDASLGSHHLEIWRALWEPWRFSVFTHFCPRHWPTS